MRSRCVAFAANRSPAAVCHRRNVGSMLLLSCLQSRARKDLETTADMSALVLEQVVSAADDVGAAVTIDLSRTEDAASLERIRNLNAVFFEGRGKPVGTPAKLTSLKEQHNAMVADKERLQEEASALRERYQTMQTQCTALLREKGELTAQVQSLEAQVSSLRSGASSLAATKSGVDAEVSSLRQQVTDMASKLESTKTELLTISKERDARLSDSKQFQSMKTLMQRKNAQLADLKARLHRYEPDGDGGDQDDTGVG